MDFLEERTNMSEEELPEHLLPPKDTPLSRPVAKEKQATKTQTFFSKTKKNESILMQIAFSVGVGSVWRFPYLCHRNGGGSFILIYLLMLVFVGIPLLHMEMVLGQWLRLDSIQIWKSLVPYLGGVGYASMLVCIWTSLYNSAIVSWSLSYLGHSFSHHLSWSHCPLVQNSNDTDLSCLLTVPHQYFWYHTTLHASGSIEEGVEALVVNLSLGMFAAWFFLCIIMATGLKVSMLFSALASLDLWRQAGGHVLYSLSLGMGTVITFASKVRGNSSIQMTLWVALVDLVISLLATTVIFLVLGFWASTSGHTCVERSVSKLMTLIAKGVLPQGATPPEDILLRPNLEYLAWIDQLPQHLQHQIVHFSPPCSIKAQKETFMDGPGLAFVAFSQAVLLVPGAPFWTIIFFLALVVMGMDTLLKISEGIVHPLRIAMPAFQNHPWLLSVVTCLGGFLGSLIFTSHSGNYVLCLFDDHLVPLTLVIIVIFQNVALAWIYGAKRFKEEMFNELAHLLCPIFPFLWCYVTLPGLLAVLILGLTQLHQRVPSYYIAWNTSASQEVKQPYLENTLAWLSFLTVLSLLPIPAHPVQQWWYYEDPINPEPLEKQLPFKKLPPDSPKSLQWPKHPLKNASFVAQEKISTVSSRGFSKPLSRGPNPESWQLGSATSRQGSQASSWFSLPYVSSLTSELSIRSVNLPPSRQVSPASTGADSSNFSGDSRQGNPHSKSVQ
ncbi:orphan sodium- and chloride-dependent neurotransmitter transporter NTT5-like isoform X2 [Tamandua tetradactyla]|uniref:orphan sodium- and chloride-dependent neurotransmitter transporter NTT5-like isoform X2 n=1 Tax=Tamandua tetradactyla TaxID=48850 RepID=UPI00405462FF